MKAPPRRMRTTGSRKYPERAGKLFPGIKSMSIFGMLVISPFHVNCDCNEVGHWSNKQRMHPGPSRQEVSSLVFETL